MTETTVVDFDQWKQWAASEECPVKGTIDFELAEELSKYFTGYMTGPVALYEGKVIASRVLTIYVHLEKVKRGIETLASQDQLFLYTIEQHLDKLSAPHWRLRYALLNDEKS